MSNADAFDAPAIINEIGWPQAKLAEKVGVDQSTVSLWNTRSTEPRGPAKILLIQTLEEVRAERGAA